MLGTQLSSDLYQDAALAHIDAAAWCTTTWTAPDGSKTLGQILSAGQTSVYAPSPNDPLNTLPKTFPGSVGGPIMCVPRNPVNYYSFSSQAGLYYRVPVGPGPALSGTWHIRAVDGTVLYGGTLSCYFGDVDNPC